MKPVEKDEIIATVIMLAVVLTLGAFIGWSARTVHTKNKLAMATYERNVAEKEYYEKQLMILQSDYQSGRGK